MLSSNPGLGEITHSITGGSLAAQGYWMPFEAAKAIAATFCWDIRYALTPIFGLDFPGTCLCRDDPNFDRMVIDPDIIKRCTAQAEQYRQESRLSSRSSSPGKSPPQILLAKRSDRLLRPKPLKILAKQHKDASDSEESYYASPDSCQEPSEGVLKIPRSLESGCCTPSSPHSRLPRDVPVLAGGTSRTTHLKLAEASSYKQISGREVPGEATCSSSCSFETTMLLEKGERGGSCEQELEAAYALVQLRCGRWQD